MPRPTLGSTAKERLTNMGKAAQKQRETQQQREQERENELRQAALQSASSLLDRTGPSYQSHTPLAQLMAEQEAERERVRQASQRANASIALSNRAQATNQIQSQADRNDNVARLALNRMGTEQVEGIRDRLQEQAASLDPVVNADQYNQTVKRGQLVQDVLNNRREQDYYTGLNARIQQAQAGVDASGVSAGLANRANIPNRPKYDDLRTVAQYLSMEADGSGMAERYGNALDYKATQMTQDEKNTVLYYIGTGEYDTAAQYLSDLERTLNERANSGFQETMTQWAQEHPVQGALTNIFSWPLSIPATVDNLGEAVRQKITGEYAPADVNRDAYLGARIGTGTSQGVQEAAREAATDTFGNETAGDVAAFLAGTGLSIGQNLTQLPLGALTLPAMAASSSGTHTVNALDRGASPGQAAILGLSNGIIEALTEKLPLENLYRLVGQTGRQGAGQVVRGILRQMGTEATEESISEIANNIVDTAVMGENSEYRQYVNQLVQNGVPQNEAEKQAFLQFYVYNTLQAAAGGALSGGILGGGASAINAIANRNSAPVDTYQPIRREDRGMLIPETREATVTTEESGPISQDTQQTTAPQIASTEDYIRNTIGNGRVSAAQMSRNVQGRGDAASALSDMMSRREVGVDAEGNLYRTNQANHGAARETERFNPLEDIDQDIRFDTVLPSVDNPSLPVAESYIRETLGEKRRSAADISQALSGQQGAADALRGTATAPDAGDSLKERQFQVIRESNPAQDDYHTWIRDANEIKTFEETLQDSDWADYDEFNPDYTMEQARYALESGEITVYSSYPIEAGVFVSPSRMEAESYSGNGQVYEQRVPLTDVAWIDPTQGQYAPVQAVGPESSVENPNLSGAETRNYEQTVSVENQITRPINGSPYINTKTYRAVASGESPISSYTGYGMFADDPNAVDMYGDSLYTVDNSALPSIDDFKAAIENAWNEDLESGMLPVSIESLAENFTGEQIAETFDPRNIVDGADAWDDPDLTTWAFDKGIFDGVPGVKTSDGSIVWDESVIQQTDKNAEILGYDQAEQERAVRAEDSTGAAPYGFDPYSNMLNEYGAIPEGENPSRVIDVPVSTDGNDRVSRAARTVMEAEITPENMLGEVADAIVRGDLSHEVVTDKAATARARKTVENKGWDGALEEFHQAARSGRLSKNNVALGQVLLNNAMNSGDSQMAIDLLVDYASLATAAGQTLQAQRMLKKLTPEGQLYGIQRSVSNIQEELQQKYRDKAPDLEIPEELIENFRNATDQDGRDAAADAIYKNIASQVPSTWADKWNAWRYMAMLTNPRTHTRNIFGNLGFVPVRMVKDAIATTLEAGADLVLPGGIQRTKAPLNPLSRADRSLVRAALSDVQNVQEQLLGSGKYADSATGKIDDYRTIFKFKPLEAVRKGNSNLMEIEDSWFSKSAYAGALAGYLKANGVTAQQMTDGTVSQETLDAGRTYAIEEAQKATYRDANALSDFISNLRYRGSNPVGRALNTVVEGVLPFRRTPANILMRGVEYSPVGLLNGVKEAVWDVHRGNKTAAEAIDDISAGLTGTGLLALGAWLASMGVVTGGGSGDDEQDAQNDLTGQQNYAMTIGDKNFTLDWLAPEALPFFVGVEAYNVMSDQSEGGVTLDNILSAFERITDPMLEMSMLQGVQDAIETVQYADSGTLLKVAANSVLSYFTQALPTLFGQIERTTEDQRYTTFMDRTNGVPTDIQYTVGQALNKVPGVEFQQIPYIDAWGRTESTGNLLERSLNNFLNPSYTSTDQTTDTDRELQRLYDVGQTGVFPDRTAQSQKVDGEYMTADQYFQYATTKGQTSYDVVTDMINSDIYQNMTDEEKANAIKKAYQYAGHIAAQEVNPDHESDSYVANATNAQDTLGVSTGEYLLMYQEYGASKMERLSELVQDGMSITDAEHLVGEKNYGSSDIQEYNEFVSAGLSDSDAENLVDAMASLKPAEGSESVSSLQKYRTMVNTVSGEENQMTALSQVMSESEYEKLSAGTDYGVSPNAYVTFKETVTQYDANGNGTLTQEEVENALDSFGGGLTLPGDTRVTLTNDQKAVLWQLQGKNWSPRNNPYNTAIGQRVYDALHEETSEETSGIRLPMA